MDIHYVIKCYHRGGIVINFRQMMSTAKITLKTTLPGLIAEPNLDSSYVPQFLNFDSYLNSTRTLNLVYNPRGAEHKFSSDIEIQGG
jgi:hypothetical protein